MNRQRLLILCSRGMTARNRYFIKDLIEMMPHSKTESKFELKSKLTAISEVNDMQNFFVLWGLLFHINTCYYLYVLSVILFKLNCY